MSILSLNSYTDLLKKCNREHNQLLNCLTHPEYDFTLFNIILAMSHLFEWYIKETGLSDDVKLKCIEEFNPYCKLKLPRDFRMLYEQLVNYPPVNEYQNTIRMLCNKAKHFKKLPIERQEKNYICSFGNTEFSETNGSFGAFDHYLYFVEINSKDVDLLELISFQLDCWNKFVEANV